MPRRIKSQKKKRDWRWYASFALNGAVALSMVLGTVLVFSGASIGQPAPIVAPTETIGAPIPAPTLTPQPTSPPTGSLAPPSPTTASSVDPTALPVSAAPLQFAVAGDSRDGDAVYMRILDRVSSDASAFLIHLGDLVPVSSTETWLRFQEMMTRFKLPFYPVIGNHDVRSRSTDFEKYSGSTKRHYSFDQGPAHFTIVDSSAGSLLDTEFDFLDQDLASSNAPVKMVFVHHPPFDPAGSSHVMVNGNARFMQIVKDRGAKYVFAGHIHCYAEAERDGVTYIITGGAGAPLSCPRDAGGYYHYVRVRVDGNKVTTEIVRVE